MRWKRRRRPPARHKRAFGAVGLALLLCALWTLCWERGLAALSPELIEEAARGYVLECLTQAVEEEMAGEESPYIQVERDGKGQITAASANPHALNQLKARVLERLSQSLNGRKEIKVPLGSLTGIRILNGRGFCVPVRMAFEGSANLRFDTEFTTAGVNQSLHRITMTVTAYAYSQSRRFEAKVEESTSTVLAETLVVGPVPSLALAGGRES